MTRRAVTRRGKSPRVQQVHGGPLDGWTLDPDAPLLRPECSGCRRPDIAWVPAARLLAALVTTRGEPEAREAFEGFRAIGAEADSPAWVCCCGEYGVVVPHRAPPGLARHGQRTSV